MSGTPSRSQSALPGAAARPADEADRLPEPRRRVDLQLLLGIALVISSVVIRLCWAIPYWTHNFTIVSLFVTVAVLQNLLLSDAGQVSFGQGAVFGAGA